MRKISLKIIMLISVFIVAMLLLGTTKSQAVLQANATTHANPVSKTGAAWITEIRQMETTGQTMGLNETLDGLEATSESNHIDVHMVLPTEYGAVAILSASGYGNSGKLQDETNVQKRTTTGNSTGVYFTGDRWECLASYGKNGINKYNNYGQKIGSVWSSPWTSGWHEGKNNVRIDGTYYNYLENGWGSYLAGGTGLFSLRIFRIPQILWR